MPNKFNIPFYVSVYFYLGKNTGSVLHGVYVMWNGFVCRQSESCVFRCADFGWRTFYFTEEKEAFDPGTLKQEFIKKEKKV